PAGEQRQLDLAAEVRQRFRVADLTGADGGGDLYRLIREAQEDQRELESLVVDVGDDVLVWKLPTFAVEQRLVRDVVRRARGRKALVLDLRGNGGGPVEVLLSLLGLLHREDVAVATQHERVRQVPLVARGAGEGAFTGQLVVLVDSRSASAAEVLARVVQLTGRGVVLGDRTAGAVMRARYRQLGTGTETAVFYGVSVTDADVVMPDGGRLEVVGVEPDELVLPRAADLAAGEDPVLARALALAGISLSAAEAGALLRQR
ncbi:MAG TPA: S41 family peptidase, partial [Longimicrobiaceae bacterium]|nr:S41 family peptidase [Longimicrobiaceae bacterium]